MRVSATNAPQPPTVTPVNGLAATFWVTVAETLPDGSAITVEPLVRTRGRLGLKDFDPCTILLNNDLSAGAPGILEELYEQYLLPPLHAGWSLRRSGCGSCGGSCSAWARCRSSSRPWCWWVR